MKKSSLAAMLLALSACSGESGPSPSPAADEAQPPTDAAPVAPPAVKAKARAVEEKNELLEFTYGWPGEAAAIPGLNARLESELERDRAEALGMAREDRAARPPEAPFHGHYLAKEWKSYGDTPHLLSLAAQVATFTGGAHGNTLFDSILWDRTLGRAIKPADLFTDPAVAFATISGAYCAALDRERVEKRQEPLPLEGEDWLIGCPSLAQQAIVPVDGDGDSRFELLRVLIPPYEAGPYVEGTYEVDVPVTDPVRGLIKPDYRTVF
ncbi:DUF3298 and DUF4163 domain-containing protein [Sphingosinicella humi]|nr:DUF3298 and DUF4163 domain-containing protein [Sphingosinicella humi]